jgi:hypothetical protein
VEQMGLLADYIATLNLKQGLEQSLTVKLRNAKRDCERGHTRRPRATSWARSTTT